MGVSHRIIWNRRCLVKARLNWYCREHLAARDQSSRKAFLKKEDLAAEGKRCRFCKATSGLTMVRGKAACAAHEEQARLGSFWSKAPLAFVPALSMRQYLEDHAVLIHARLANTEWPAILRGNGQLEVAYDFEFESHKLLSEAGISELGFATVADGGAQSAAWAISGTSGWDHYVVGLHPDLTACKREIHRHLGNDLALLKTHLAVKTHKAAAESLANALKDINTNEANLAFWASAPSVAKAASALDAANPPVDCAVPVSEVPSAGDRPSAVNQDGQAVRIASSPPGVVKEEWETALGLFLARVAAAATNAATIAVAVGVMFFVGWAMKLLVFGQLTPEFATAVVSRAERAPLAARGAPPPCICKRLTPKFASSPCVLPHCKPRNPYAKDPIKGVLDEAQWIELVNTFITRDEQADATPSTQLWCQHGRPLSNLYAAACGNMLSKQFRMVLSSNDGPDGFKDGKRFHVFFFEAVGGPAYRDDAKCVRDTAKTFKAMRLAIQTMQKHLLSLGASAETVKRCEAHSCVVHETTMRGYTMYAARDGLFVADKVWEMDLPKRASDLPALGHETVKCLLLNVKSRIVGAQRYFAAECSKARGGGGDGWSRSQAANGVGGDEPSPRPNQKAPKELDSYLWRLAFLTKGLVAGDKEAVAKGELLRRQDLFGVLVEKVEAVVKALSSP
ncbi:hypothetical protein HDU89_006874 [Geranomyces variabilis]|nr:hypothetical protein HDU89_006874 [Geranomyces variabilis]